MSAEIHLNVDSSETRVAAKAAQRNRVGEEKTGVFKETLPFVLTEQAGPREGFGPLMRLIWGGGGRLSVTGLRPLQLPQRKFPLNNCRTFNLTHDSQEQARG